jgi:hypothetical protein
MYPSVTVRLREGLPHQAHDGHVHDPEVRRLAACQGFIESRQLHGSCGADLLVDRRSDALVPPAFRRGCDWPVVLPLAVAALCVHAHRDDDPGYDDPGYEYPDPQGHRIV